MIFAPPVAYVKMYALLLPSLKMKYVLLWTGTYVWAVEYA